MGGRTMAEVWVAVRPDTSKTGAELDRKLGALDVSKSGEKAGDSFGSGFGRSVKRIAGLAAAALASRAVVEGVKGSVSAASDLNETVSKTQQIFGKSSAAIQAFAAKAPTALGQTKQAALDANATFGLFGKSAGLTGTKLTGFTTKLTTLAGDLASFNNTTPEQAIEALGAALRGESEPIRAYGVLLDDATLKAEAMSLGLLKPTKNLAEIKIAQQRAMLAQINYNKAVKEHGKGSVEALRAQTSLGAAQNSLRKKTEGTVGPLTQQQKVLAAQSAIMKQTTTAQGDFARTSSGLANQQRIAAAQANKLKVAIGNALLPVVLSGATALNQKLLPPLIDLAEKHGPKLGAALHDAAVEAGPFITNFLEKASGLFTSLNAGTNEASPALTSLADSGSKLSPVVQDLAEKIPSLTDMLTVSATVIGFLADNTDTLAKLMPLLVAGVVAYKVAQLAANVAQVIGIPMKVAEVVVNRQLVKSNRELIASRAGVIGVTVGSTAATAASTTATAANTAATNTNAAASGRHRIAVIASTIAQKAAAIASTVFSVALRAVGIAVRFALGPVGLIITGIALAAAGLIYAYKHSETFRKIVDTALRVVAATGKWMWENILKPVFSALIWYFKLVWQSAQTFARIVKAGFDAIKEPARAALAFVVDHFLGFIETILTGAAKAFGLVPKLGPKLEAVAAGFAKFRDNVNTKLAGIKDQSVTIKPVFDKNTMSLASAGRRALGGPGGPVNGPGSTTSDQAGLYALSNKEWVIKAASSMKYGDRAMAAVNAGRATIIPDGGFATGGSPGFTVRTPMPNTSQFAREVAAHSVKIAKPFAQQIANQLMGPGGPPGARQSFRGVTLNERTIRMLLTAERILGRIFRITQGSYSTRVAASGSTHAGGGAMDTNGPGGWGTSVAALRRAGFAAWRRTPAQGPWPQHIHSIAIGDTSASPAAKGQVRDFLRGGNGLRGMTLGGKVVLRDNGGPVPPGTFAYNGTSKTETMLTAEQAASRGRPIIVENHIEIGGEVVRVVRTEIDGSDTFAGTRRRMGAR